MEQHSITPHETLQLHELLTMKNLSLTKTLLMSPIVSDPDLKAILQNDTASCSVHIKQLRDFMLNSDIAKKNLNYSQNNRETLQ